MFSQRLPLAFCLLLSVACFSSADEKKPKHTNLLAKETSPYLLLHAHNPVDWRPWNKESLEKAKKEGKPIFLSIGYSSCYWCHVMERESFMDEEIAEYLNEHFVPIKVDREERPDVDEIYMTSLQVYNQLTGSVRGGGWPLSMFLTPEGKPIGGGTYFPPRKKEGNPLPGFLTVLEQVHESWKENEENVEKQAEYIAEQVKRELSRKSILNVEPAGAEVLAALEQALADDFDARHGGFRFSEANPRIPKFPEPSNLVFLLNRVRRTGSSQARKMLVKTLEEMASGGIYDHLGGGFHRYSTDRFWRIPHFEKMLYDNGQLLSLYAESYELTGREDFRRTAEGIADYILREMRSEGGAFYSALDAETEEEEGRFYVWETEELKELLTDKEFALAADVWGVGGEGNFEGRHTLLLPQPLKEVAQQRETTVEMLLERLEPIREKLLATRDERERPLMDTKILTAWNGLMIHGLADAGRILKNDRYVEAAEKAAGFLLDKLATEDGRLLRTFAGGQAKLNAYVDDYAFLVHGLLGLHQATGEDRWLEAAQRLTDKQIELFWDDDGGGFFYTSADHETLLVRSKGPMDGARPAGNSISALNLIYLAEQLDEPKYRKLADETVQAHARILNRAPAAMPRMAVALAKLQEDKTKETPAGPEK